MDTSNTPNSFTDTDQILHLQEIIGEDFDVCRDLLAVHNGDLEAVLQERLGFGGQQQSILAGTQPAPLAPDYLESFNYHLRVTGSNAPSDSPTSMSSSGEVSGQHPNTLDSSPMGGSLFSNLQPSSFVPATGEASPSLHALANSQNISNGFGFDSSDNVSWGDLGVSTELRQRHVGTSSLSSAPPVANLSGAPVQYSSTSVRPQTPRSNAQSSLASSASSRSTGPNGATSASNQNDHTSSAQAPNRRAQPFLQRSLSRRFSDFALNAALVCFRVTYSLLTIPVLLTDRTVSIGLHILLRAFNFMWPQQSDSPNQARSLQSRPNQTASPRAASSSNSNASPLAGSFPAPLSPSLASSLSSNTPNLRGAAAEVYRFVERLDRQFSPDSPTVLLGRVSLNAARPPLLITSYNEALAESRRELRFLLVYLHGDDHLDTPRFCREIFYTAAFAALIQERRLLVWACNVNSTEGYHVSEAVRETTYPLMALIGPRENRMIIIGRIDGFTSLANLRQHLVQVMEAHADWLASAQADRYVREETQSIRAAQDAAYLESLRADKQKERERREREETARRKEDASRQRELFLQECRALALSLVPAAPDDATSRSVSLCEPISLPPTLGKSTGVKNMDLSLSSNLSAHEAIRLSFYMPNGERLSHTFLLSTHTLRELWCFVFSHANAPEQFRLVTNFPRRSLPTEHINPLNMFPDIASHYPLLSYAYSLANGNDSEPDQATSSQSSPLSKGSTHDGKESIETSGFSNNKADGLLNGKAAENGLADGDNSIEHKAPTECSLTLRELGLGKGTRAELLYVQDLSA